MTRRPFRVVMTDIAKAHPHLLKKDGTLNANAIARDVTRGGRRVSQATITRLLRGDHVGPSRPTSEAISARYGVSAAFVRGEETMAQELDIPLAVVILARRMMALPFEARRKVGDLIATFEELTDKEEQLPLNIAVVDPLTGRTKSKRR